MKRTIRLNESELKNLIKKSTYRILREYGSDGPDFEERNEQYLDDDDDFHGRYPSDMDPYDYDDIDTYDYDEFNPDMDDEHGISRGSEDFKTPSTYPGDEPEILGSGVDDFANNPMAESRIRRAVRESVNKVLRKRNLYKR